MECILCGGEIEKKYDIKGRMYWDQGENAQPLADGQCCLECNMHVIAARILEFSTTTRLKKIEKHYKALKENGGESLTLLNRKHKNKLRAEACLKDIYNYELKILPLKLNLMALARKEDSGFHDLSLLGLPTEKEAK